ERSIAAHEQPNERSRFTPKHRNPRTAITLTTPGTARRAITVASCRNDDSLQVGISRTSGRGPTRDARRKPELTAPGEPVVSTRASPAPGESPHWALSGTSMAAPHVAGVVARMLGRNAYLMAEEIRDILVRTAARPG